MMTDPLRGTQRVRFAFGGVILVAIAATLAVAGFAFSGVWPGFSWAIGAGLGFVLLLPATRWLRAAITGRAPRAPGQSDRRGTI
jgi:hypothetical protein